MMGAENRKKQREFETGVEVHDNVRGTCLFKRGL